VGVSSARKQEIEAEYMAKFNPILKALFSDVHKVGVYFPLGRHGDFWIRIGKGKDGETQFFDSENARNIYYEQVGVKAENDGVTVEKGNHPDQLRDKLFVETNKLQITEVLKQAFITIDDLGQKIELDQSTGAFGLDKSSLDSLKNDFLEVYLRALPGADLRKRYLRSTMKSGFSSDVVRTFINYSYRNSNQMPRLKYGIKLSTQLSAAMDATEGMPDRKKEAVQDIVRAIAARAQPEINPQNSTSPNADAIAQFANQVTFLWTMTSIRTAVVAFTQLPTFGASALYGRYGIEDTVTMMDKYTKLILTGNALSVKDTYENLSGNLTSDLVMPTLKGSKYLAENPRLADAYAKGMLWNVYAQGFGSQFRAAAEKPTREQFTTWTRGTNLAMTIATGALTTTERLSREIMFMSTYELAFAKAKKEKLDTTAAHEKALDMAEEITHKTMFDYSKLNKQPFLYKNPVMRVLTQFMTFPLNATGFMLRNAATLLSTEKKKDPAAAKVAAFELLGMLLSVFMFAGVTGLPLYSVIMGAMEALRDQLFDPKDYPDRRDPRSNIPLHIWFTGYYLPEKFGREGKSIVQSGPISALFDVNIGSSVGLNNLFFRDEVLADGAKDWLQQAMLGFLSPPVGSVATQITSGIQLMNEGNFNRGVERILPAGLKQFATMYRLSQEGSRTPTGNKLLEKEFFTAGKLIMQGAGFKTVTEAELQNGIAEGKKFQISLDKERSRLLNLLNSAYMNIETAREKGISTDRADAKFDSIIDKMIEFSIVNPVFGYTEEGIEDSIKSKAESRAKSEFFGGFSAATDEKLQFLFDIANPNFNSAVNDKPFYTEE
jgi:hypothetical protein